MLSPYRSISEFVVPYTTEVHESLLAMGIRTFQLHLSGRWKQILPYAAKLPLGDWNMVSIDHPTDLAEATKVFGEKAVIVGNLDTSIIQTGTPLQVYEMSRECIEKGKRASVGLF